MSHHLCETPVTVNTSNQSNKLSRALRALCLACVAVAFLFEMGCAIVTVDSNPPGARLVYSETGLPPWRAWQPEKGNAVAPSTAAVKSGTIRFIRAEKDGFYPSLPQLVEAFAFKPAKISFELAPTPEWKAQQKRAAGFVFYEGEWIRPETKGLVEYKGQWMTREEKDSREKTDAGLVMFEGRWVAADERDRLFAEKRKAEGLLLYKGQWIAPDELERQEGIDQIIDRALKMNSEPLPTIEKTDRKRPGEPAIVIFNLTGRPLKAYLSGPISLEIAVGPADYENREIPTGVYQLALKSTEDGQPMMVGELTVFSVDSLGRGAVYSLIYKGKSEPASDVFPLDKRFANMKSKSESK